MGSPVSGFVPESSSACSPEPDDPEEAAGSEDAHGSGTEAAGGSSFRPQAVSKGRSSRPVKSRQKTRFNIGSRPSFSQIRQVLRRYHNNLSAGSSTNDGKFRLFLCTRGNRMRYNKFEFWEREAIKMAGRGFIHDKLEIKFLILYLAARVIEPVPFDTVLDLTMCDDAIDYFDFSECLAELVRTGHLSLSEDGLYAITEKGMRNSKICETSLPYSVRLRCDRNLDTCNRRLRRKSQVKAFYAKRANGTYTVSLSLSDDMGSVMDLNLMVVREDMARMLSDRFRKSPERIYNAIMNLLLSDGQDDKSEK
jgi:hypothetical protein